MRELPEPEGQLAWQTYTRDQVLAIQKQAYEDGLRDAGKDSQLIEWLAKNLDWDGHAYWLPEICIKVRQLGDSDFVAEPSAEELRAILTASQKDQK